MRSLIELAARKNSEREAAALQRLRTAPSHDSHRLRAWSEAGERGGGGGGREEGGRGENKHSISTVMCLFTISVLQHSQDNVCTCLTVFCTSLSMVNTT